MINLEKSHPVVFRGPVSHAQAHAGNYRKRKVKWQGMTVTIENEAGSIRRGRNRDGHEWEQRMTFPYGYLNRTEGVDGDHVDVFLGPDLSSPTVYVIHQRKYGDWESYDEDKCMVGFSSEEEAKAAFLASYSDPRFLGPVTAMPVAEFLEKAKATKEAPAMIKAVLFLKSRIDPYIRSGRLVRGYTNNVVVNKRKDVGDSQLSLVFPKPGDWQTVPPTEPPPKEVKMFYVTMIRDPGPKQKVALLAGPYVTHEQAKGYLDLARDYACDLDPRAHFDYFGTAAMTAAEDKFPVGKLNGMLER